MEVLLFDEMIRVKKNKKSKLLKKIATPFLDSKKFEYLKEIIIKNQFQKNFSLYQIIQNLIIKNF